MRAGSLFTGTGALDMAAAAVLGAEPAWFCDLDPGASALLAHHYPDVPNLKDITRVGLAYSDEEWAAMQAHAAEDEDYELPMPDWSTVEPVEVLTGGFPCQDISNAGKREGITGARSGLWSYYADAIRALRPRYVLVENVGALVVRGLDRVLADLAALGFDAEWAAVRASDVGAPHQRERIFIAATRHAEVRGRDDAPVAGQRRGSAGAAGGPSVAPPDASGDAIGEQPVAESGRGGTAVAGLDHAAAADAAGTGRQGHVTPRSPSGTEPQADADAERNGGTPAADAYGRGRRADQLDDAARKPNARRGAAPDTDGGRLAGHAELDLGTEGGIEASRRLDTAGRVLEWGPYEPAIRRWERILGRPAPAPTATGARGGRVLNPALPEWMMGLPDGWIAAVPGLSRAAQLKLAGNGVVPQQAIAAFRYLLDLLELDARSAA